MEDEILGFGIRNTAQGTRNPINDWNCQNQIPLTKTGIQCLESGIHGAETRIQDFLEFPYMVQHKRRDKLFLSFDFAAHASRTLQKRTNTLSDPN